MALNAFVSLTKVGILFAGGCTDVCFVTGLNPEVLKSVDLYHVKNNSWTSIAGGAQP